MQGNAKLSANELDAALDLYSRSLELHPSAAVLANRAHVHLMLENNSAAERDCTEAINVLRPVLALLRAQH